MSELSTDEQATVDRFGIFEPEQREEAVVEEVARAIYDGVVGQWTGDIRDLLAVNMDPRPIAVAAVAAYRATQDGGRVGSSGPGFALLHPGESYWTLDQVRAALDPS